MRLRGYSRLAARAEALTPRPRKSESAFEDFKFDKNPFYLIKPDGTSDLTLAQQEEAAAIFDDVFY